MEKEVTEKEEELQNMMHKQMSVRDVWENRQTRKQAESM